MKRSPVIIKLQEYEKDGYALSELNAEEQAYKDSETGQSGLRVIVTLILDKPDPFRRLK